MLSAVYAVVVCRSVCLSLCVCVCVCVCLSHSGIVSQVALLWQRDRATACQQKFCNYKTSNLKSIVWHYLQMDGQTDGQTHDDDIYRA